MRIRIFPLIILKRFYSKKEIFFLQQVKRYPEISLIQSKLTKFKDLPKDYLIGYKMVLSKFKAFIFILFALILCIEHENKLFFFTVLRQKNSMRAMFEKALPWTLVHASLSKNNFLDKNVSLIK